MPRRDGFRQGRKALVDFAALSSSTPSLGSLEDEEIPFPSSGFVPAPVPLSSASPPFPSSSLTSSPVGGASLSSLISYATDEEEDEEVTSKRPPHLPQVPLTSSSSSISSSFSSPSPITSPPSQSLDAQLHSFLSRISPLLSTIEAQHKAEEEVYSSPSTSWFSSTDPSNGRPFYFDQQKCVVTWNRPSTLVVEVKGKEMEMEEEDAGKTERPPSLSADDRLRASFALLQSMLEAVRRGLKEEDVKGQVECAVLECEMRIRREDWEAQSVSTEYVEEKIRTLTERVEERVTALRASLLPPPAPAVADSSPSVPLTEISASAVKSEIQTVPKRRLSAVISRPPSSPFPTSSPSPSPSVPSITSTPSLPPPVSSTLPSRPSKMRRVEEAGAVGALVQKWKGVKAKGEKERREEEEGVKLSDMDVVQRMEAEVRREQGRSGHPNPNFIPIGDWNSRAGIRGNPG